MDGTPGKMSGDPMTKRFPILLGICVYVVASLLQAVWESPLRNAIAYITDPGCRFARYIAKPDYSLNGTVWRFDMIAATVNALVYFIVLFTCALLLKRARDKTRRDRTP